MTAAKLSLSTTSLALRQFETEMADLVKSRTEIECLIDDFKQANVNGQQRRTDAAKELKKLEKRIATLNGRLEELSEDLDARVKEEKDAKEA